MPDQPIDRRTLRSIVAETILDARHCTSENCHNFRLLTSPLLPGEYVVIYTKVYWTADEKADVQPRWLCFNGSGSRTGCDPKFTSIAEKNRIYRSFKTIVQWPTVAELRAEL